MRCDSAAVRRDLPIPGSPETSTTRPSPSFACCQRRNKRSSSSSRPTSGVVPERNASKRLTTPLSPTTRQAGCGSPKPASGWGPRSSISNKRADLSPGAVGNDQGARPGQRLQSGGEVWRLADHAALLRGTGADQIANDDEAAGDADPHVQRLLCGEPADRVDDREPGASRALGIVLMRLGIAEINQHAVAHILGDKTAKAGDGVGDAAMVGADDLAQILGIEARRQRRRADQVAEHHRQLAPLGLAPRGSGRLSLQLRRPRGPRSP